jgi:hypothetical protein
LSSFFPRFFPSLFLLPWVTLGDVFGSRFQVPCIAGHLCHNSHLCFRSGHAAARKAQTTPAGESYITSLLLLHFYIPVRSSQICVPFVTVSFKEHFRINIPSNIKYCRAFLFQYVDYFSAS